MEITTRRAEICTHQSATNQSLVTRHITAGTETTFHSIQTFPHLDASTLITDLGDGTIMTVAMNADLSSEIFHESNITTIATDGVIEIQETSIVETGAQIAGEMSMAEMGEMSMAEIPGRKSGICRSALGGALHRKEANIALKVDPTAVAGVGQNRLHRHSQLLPSNEDQNSLKQMK